VNLLETLGVQIGERMAGSPEAAASAEQIASAFRELELEPRFQEFQFLGYETDDPELEIEGETWPAGPMAYAPPTPPEGVEGRIRYLGDYPFIPGIMTPPVFAIEEGDGTEHARLMANPIGGGAIPFPTYYRLPVHGGPMAMISTEDGERLKSLDRPHARLRTEGRYVPGLRDRNVIAELRGSSEEHVIVSAHFDSVWRGPGVIDNATGVEGLLRVATRFAGRDDLPRSLVFCAFGAEEIGLAGSRYFVDEAKVSGDLDRTVGVVNLDCIGRGSSFVLMVGPDELKGRAVALAEQLGFAERYELAVYPPLNGSDHFPFALEKVPAACILHFPYPEYHLPSEALDLVDEQRMEDAVELAVALVESQLERPVPRG
jgi:Peptidase family M28